MINKDVTHPRMKRMIKNPRIVLLDCSLEYKKGESQVQRSTALVLERPVVQRLTCLFASRPTSRSARRRTSPESCRWRKITSSRSVKTSSASSQTWSSPRRGFQVRFLSTSVPVHAGAVPFHSDHLFILFQKCFQWSLGYGCEVTPPLSPSPVPEISEQEACVAPISPLINY